MIKNSAIEAAAYEIMARAAIDIPEDYKTGLRGMLDGEKGELSHFVLEAMLDNYDAAEEDRRPMCASRRAMTRGSKAGLLGWKQPCAGRLRAQPRMCRCAPTGCTH